MIKTITDPNLPDVWIQNNEDEACADCGCQLVRSQDGSGPALSYCNMHRQAHAMLKTLQTVLAIALNSGWTAPEETSARRDICDQIKHVIEQATKETK